MEVPSEGRLAGPGAGGPSPSRGRSRPVFLRLGERPTSWVLGELQGQQRLLALAQTYRNGKAILNFNSQEPSRNREVQSFVIHKALAERVKDLGSSSGSSVTNCYAHLFLFLALDSSLRNWVVGENVHRCVEGAPKEHDLISTKASVMAGTPVGPTLPSCLLALALAEHLVQAAQRVRPSCTLTMCRGLPLLQAHVHCLPLPPEAGSVLLQVGRTPGIRLQGQLPAGG